MTLYRPVAQWPLEFGYWCFVYSWCPVLSKPDPATPFWSGQDQGISVLVLCRDTGAQDNFIARQAVLFSPQPFPIISIQPPSPELWSHL